MRILHPRMGGSRFHQLEGKCGEKNLGWEAWLSSYFFPGLVLIHWFLGERDLGTLGSKPTQRSVIYAESPGTAMLCVQS